MQRDDQRVISKNWEFAAIRRNPCVQGEHRGKQVTQETKLWYRWVAKF